METMVFQENQLVKSISKNDRIERVEVILNMIAVVIIIVKDREIFIRSIDLQILEMKKERIIPEELEVLKLITHRSGL